MWQDGFISWGISESGACVGVRRWVFYLNLGVMGFLDIYKNFLEEVFIYYVVASGLGLVLLSLFLILVKLNCSWTALLSLKNLADILAIAITLL